MPVAAYRYMTQTSPLVHRFHFRHHIFEKVVPKRWLSSETSSIHIRLSKLRCERISFLHSLPPRALPARTRSSLLALHPPASPVCPDLAFEQYSHFSSFKMESTQDGAIPLSNDYVTAPLPNDFEDYHFPINRLKRSLEDPSKTPLVLVACGSFSPYVYFRAGCLVP